MSVECLTVNRLFNIDRVVWRYPQLLDVKVGGEPDDDDSVLLVDASRTPRLDMTSTGLKRQAHRAASQLDSLLPNGLQGTSLAVILQNGAEYVVTFLAICCGNGINCLLNPSYKKSEISFAVQDLDCKAIVASAYGFELTEVNSSASSCRVPLILVDWNYDNGEWCINFALQTPTKPVAAGSESSNSKTYEWPHTSGNDVVLKLHTSGTTSKPKTVPLRHKNIVASCMNQADWFKWNCKSDICMLVMPLFHVHGLFNGCIGPLATRTRVCIPATKHFSASQFWAQLLEFDANIVTAVPSIWQILMLHEDIAVEALKRAKRPLRYIRGCSSSLDPSLNQKLRTIFQCSVVESYAMTEANHQMTSTRLGEGEEAIGSIGVPTGIEVCIIDPESGTVCTDGESGEICVRGLNVITGYEGLSEEANTKLFWFQNQLTVPNPDASSWMSTAPLLPSLDRSTLLSKDPAPNASMEAADSAFRKIMSEYKLAPLQQHNLDLSAYPELPFLRTGDKGKIVSQHLHHESRLKELINRGGEKISPAEVDVVLLHCSSVEEAATFGYPDAILGEVVACCVVPHDKEFLVDDMAKEAFAAMLLGELGDKLTKAKRPANVFVVDEIPKGPTGKIQRRLLHDFVTSRFVKK